MTYKPTHLLAHLHFLPTPQANQKNAKEPSSQRTKTAVNIDRQDTTERTPACNSTYPKGGVSFFTDTFVQAESSVLRMKFSGKNPALRVAANRYVP
ncbi:hypothetical protein SAMN05216323_11042 [Williamwhitmania taraxaci]|uniref:Uncharacterized protein n=1 Tax=Williamwhitmania taraxaci TaxID=1640674 RepID=A0A1G6SW80_9BACT|nr:hypothetical protein SAMN05216323_11042 [Williamwhitmania taraxaci]